MTPSCEAAASSASARAQLLAVELGQSKDAAAAALDVEQGLAVAQHHVGAGGCVTAGAGPSSFGQGRVAP